MVGAIDGCHLEIAVGKDEDPNSFYNYKKYHSIVLMVHIFSIQFN